MLLWIINPAAHSAFVTNAKSMRILAVYGVKLIEMEKEFPFKFRWLLYHSPKFFLILYTTFLFHTIIGEYNASWLAWSMVRLLSVAHWFLLPKNPNNTFTVFTVEIMWIMKLPPFSFSLISVSAITRISWFRKTITGWLRKSRLLSKVLLTFYFQLTC